MALGRRGEYPRSGSPGRRDGDPSTSLQWHRWLGLAGAAGAIGAALLSTRLDESSRRPVFAYRSMLFATALLVAITGHLGGTLVWGAGFLRP
jgi:uncharacterized membrane protein